MRLQKYRHNIPSNFQLFTGIHKELYGWELPKMDYTVIIKAGKLFSLLLSHLKIEKKSVIYVVWKKTCAEIYGLGQKTASSFTTIRMIVTNTICKIPIYHKPDCLTMPYIPSIKAGRKWCGSVLSLAEWTTQASLIINSAIYCLTMGNKHWKEKQSAIS